MVLVIECYWMKTVSISLKIYFSEKHVFLIENMWFSNAKYPDVSLNLLKYGFSGSCYFQRIGGPWHKPDDIEQYHNWQVFTFHNITGSPLIRDRDGCVNTAAEADIVERVDDLNRGVF